MKVWLSAGLPVLFMFGKELSPFRGRHHSLIVDCMRSKKKKIIAKAMIYGEV
jgi:hypothetical protein